MLGEKTLLTIEITLHVVHLQQNCPNNSMAKLISRRPRPEPQNP
jgi:hypothetical protein